MHACRSLTVTCMHCPATPCSGSPPGCILSRAASHAGPPCPPSTSSTLPKAVTARPARRDILRPAQEHRVQRGGSSLGTFIVTSEAGPDVSVTVSSPTYNAYTFVHTLFTHIRTHIVPKYSGVASGDGWWVHTKLSVPPVFGCTRATPLGLQTLLEIANPQQ